MLSNDYEVVNSDVNVNLSKCKVGSQSSFIRKKGPQKSSSEPPSILVHYSMANNLLT